MEDDVLVDDKPVEKTVDDIINLLGVDDDKVDEKIDDKEDEKLDTKDDKKDDEIDEDPEPDLDKLEIASHASRREIEKKYPKLFEEFPTLARAYYKDQQFAEVGLPTLQDAKEAVERANQFEQFEGKLLSGSTEEILKSVKDTDSEAFYKIVDSYLPTLQKVDEKAYNHILRNVFTNLTVSMLNDGEGTKNEDLVKAAQICYSWLFPGQRYTAPSMLSKGDNSETEKLSKERSEFEQSKFDDAVSTLDTRVQNILKSSITDAIDPKGSMTDYVKKTAIKDVLALLDENLEGDTRFKSIINKHWEKARESKLSKDSLEKIRSTYLSKAKSVLPSLIQKVRNEAIKGLAKGNKAEVEEDKKETSSRSATTTRDKGKQEIPKGMSGRDYIMSD